MPSDLIPISMWPVERTTNYANLVVLLLLDFLKVDGA